MDTLIVNGPTSLHGTFRVAGAKNVALKALVASLLTDETVTLTNVPDIRDVRLMIEVLEHLGSTVSFALSTLRIEKKGENSYTVPLDVGARLRTSSMVLGPLLARFGHATIPNPGGCRIGARPIGRHIEGLEAMGAHISYDSGDGFFHATAEKLHGAPIVFEKNTHTGTETMILAAVLADGQTTIDNAAEEVEVDELIALLVSMGADIKRTTARTIVVTGVATLHGTTFRIMSDRNEEVTLACAAIASKGDIIIEESSFETIGAFLDALAHVGAGFERLSDTVTRYFYKGPITAYDVTTLPHPGFMTDWQSPWSVMMTQATGVSIMHETVFENRFAYVAELQKMGANIEFFTPSVDDPTSVYNFDIPEDGHIGHQAIKITGPTALHNAVVSMNDLRAGATILIAAMIASGESIISGVEQIDRGYERIEERLNALGAKIKRNIGL